MSFLASISRTLGAVVVGGMLVSSSVSAAILFEQLPDASPTGLQADNATGSYANALTLAGRVVIEKITWWGYHGSTSLGGASDNFVVWFDGVSRDGELNRFGDSGQAYDLIRYEWTLPSTGFSFGGGDATLQLINASDDVEWYWQGSQADPNTSEGPRAFRIEGTRQVPEPRLPWLIGLAGAGLVLARRRSAIHDRV